MTEGNGTRPPYDPAAALRALADTPRAGLEAAATVIDRLLEMGRPGTGPMPVIPWDGTTRADEAPPSERRVQLRRARADAERVLDAYGDWARQLLDAVFGLAEGEGPDDVLVLGPVAPGTSADAELWLHAPPGRVTAPAVLRATTLTNHDGATIEGDAVCFAPVALDGNGSGQSTRVRLDVPAATAAGRYHGHVLATGLPEVALPVRVEVVDA